MKKKNLIIAAFSLALLCIAGVKPAIAYFTDVTEASGMVKVSVGNSPTTPDESKTQTGSMEKHVVIANTGSYDVYIRMRAITAGNYSTEMISGDNWTTGTDETGLYYEYSEIVAPGESASEIVVKINVNDASITNDFNVIIVQEAAKVHYNEAGEPYANWDEKITTEQEVNN